MEEKSNEEKPKNEPLPANDDKFWPNDADNRTFETKQTSCTNGHKFYMTKKANEVKCNCGVGYILANGMELWSDGHIYYEHNLVI